LKSVKDVLSEGDTVQVKVVGFEKNGKIRLSRKVLLPKPEQEDQK
jgi:polyribonucleotide nucleotidyltransferase